MCKDFAIFVSPDRNRPIIVRLMMCGPILIAAVRPKCCGLVERLDLPLFPPRLFIATRMKIPMVKRAERHGERVGYLPPHGAGLGEAQVMGL